MDELVTIFGGGGFVGRYLVQELVRAGARVRVAVRDSAQAFFLKPLGGLGQTQVVAADVTRAGTLGRAVEGATAVVNLVGTLAGDFARIHVDGARNAATAAAHAGARRFVQVSAIGADPAAEAAYARTKGQGEAAAREAFPGATVVRPSIVFGTEDQFVNRFAGLISRLPVVPVIRPGATFQPAWVGDVARAIATAALTPDRFAGATLELGGPERLTMLELNRFIADAIGRPARLLPVPDGAAAALARFGGWLPGAPITWDQWLMLGRDNVVAPGATGFEALGIAPRPLAAIAPRYLVRYRREGRFSLGVPA